MRRYHTPAAEVIPAQYATADAVDETGMPLLLQLANQSKWAEDFVTFERAVRKAHKYECEDDRLYDETYAGTPYEKEKNTFVKYARLLTLSDVRNMCVRLGLKGLFQNEILVNERQIPRDLNLSRSPTPAYYDVKPHSSRGGFLYSDKFPERVLYACCGQKEGSPGCWVEYDGHSGPYQVWFELKTDLWKQISEETITEDELERLVRSTWKRGLVFMEEAKCEVIHRAIQEYLQANARKIAQTYANFAQAFEDDSTRFLPAPLVTLDPLLNLLRYYNRSSTDEGNFYEFKGDPWQLSVARTFYTEDMRAYARNAQGDKIKLLPLAYNESDLQRVSLAFPATQSTIQNLRAAQNFFPQIQKLQIDQAEIARRLKAVDGKLDQIGWKSAQIRAAEKRLKDIEAARGSAKNVMESLRKRVNLIAKGKNAGSVPALPFAMPSLYSGEVDEMERLSREIRNAIAIKDLTEKQLRDALLRDGDFVASEEWFRNAKLAYAFQSLKSTSSDGQKTLERIRDMAYAAMEREEKRQKVVKKVVQRLPTAEAIRKLPTLQSQFLAFRKLDRNAYGETFKMAYDAVVAIGYFREWTNEVVELLLQAMEGDGLAFIRLSQLQREWDLRLIERGRLSYSLDTVALPPLAKTLRIVRSNFEWYRNSCPYDALFSGIFKNPSLVIEQAIRGAKVVYPQKDEANFTDEPNVLHAYILNDMHFMQDDKFFDRSNCMTPQAWRAVLNTRNNKASATNYEDDAVALASSLMDFYDIPSQSILFEGEAIKPNVDVVIANFANPSALNLRNGELVILCLLVFTGNHWHSYVRDVRSGEWWNFDALAQIQEIVPTLGNGLPRVQRGRVEGAIYVRPPQTVPIIIDDDVERVGKLLKDGSKSPQEKFDSLKSLQIEKLYVPEKFKTAFKLAVVDKLRPEWGPGIVEWLVNILYSKGNVDLQLQELQSWSELNQNDATKKLVLGISPPDILVKNGHVDETGKPIVKNDGYDVVRQMASENLNDDEAIEIAVKFLLRNQEIRDIEAMKK